MVDEHACKSSILAFSSGQSILPLTRRGVKFSQLEMSMFLSIFSPVFTLNNGLCRGGIAAPTRISLSDKEIIWLSSGIAAPSTVNDPSRLQLPFVLERVS